MKKILSLMAGAVLLLALGIAYADETPPGSTDTGGTMIRNDDLERYDADQGKGTFNVMPALPEEAGSAPGGVSGRYKTPAEKKTKIPADSERITEVLPRTRTLTTTEHRSGKPIGVHLQAG